MQPEIRNWAESEWWVADEYARVYEPQLTRADVSRAIHRVARVFDEKWMRKRAPHPMLGWLLATGLWPLQTLFELGQDLLTLDGADNFRPVIQDLRLGSHFDSARLELSIAATLKRRDHCIAFRPQLPNSQKKADFVARLAGEHVYFEMKHLGESDFTRTLHRYLWRVGEAVRQFFADSSHPALRATNYEIDLDPWFTTILGSGQTNDDALIEDFMRRLLNAIQERAESGEELRFPVPRLASVFVGKTADGRSSVNWAMPSPETELKRLLRRLAKAPSQLHPDHPGIIVAQTTTALERDSAVEIVSGLVKSIGPSIRHLSAVLVIPVISSFPGPWALFRPFAVENPAATKPARCLAAYEHLQSIITSDVGVPGEGMTQPAWTWKDALIRSQKS